MAVASDTRSKRSLLDSRQRRVLLENLTAYLFLAPAGILIFLFGIFPVGFAFFVSLHQWRRFPEQYQGLENYVQALDSLAYVLFFWLSLGALIYAGLQLYRFWQKSADERKSLIYLIPGAVNATALLLIVRWFFTLLPTILEIPQRIRGQERVQGTFINELIVSLQMPQVVDAANLMLVGIIAAVGISILISSVIKVNSNENLLRTTMIWLFGAIGVFTLQLTLGAIDAAITTARAAGTELPIWSQIILISAGVGLLALAYGTWQYALKQQEQTRFIAFIGAALLLMVGGYLLIAEIPPILARADDDMLKGLVITVMFAAGTVPVQLALGLLVAVMLFRKIKGKSFFRIVYFLPYITPFVATSIGFRNIFSQSASGPINQLIGLFGIEQQKWLLESIGVGRLIFGPQLPEVLAGPSLALIVIMIYTIWTYVGYDAVVFLAGLGTISGELSEAARIDGASEWSIFRNITLPLLSPTTFFLTLVALIGTFKAFTQIWILRTPAAASSVDTVSVYIFQMVRENSNLGYGSAMAFVLFGVILVLTVVQNRIAARRVFYG